MKQFLQPVEAFFAQFALTTEFLILVGIGFALILGAAYLGRRIAMSENSESLRNKKLVNYSMVSTRLRLRQLIYYGVGTASLWLAFVICQALGLNAEPLRILANLFTAWSVIRVLTAIIDKSIVGFQVAVVVWFITALNILKIRDAVSQILEDINFKAGDYEISALSMVSTLIIFSLLFWAIGFFMGWLDRYLSRVRTMTAAQKLLMTKVARIFLSIIAVLIGLQIIGIDLTALTVLSGTIGIGLGLGLQAVFSNFVSGIILLVDKTVKPGDTITLGDTYGKVTSMGARCVSVETRDGKSNLIPNELLIKNHVENWSFDNANVRLSIPIGVAYGTDPHLVRRLLLQAAESIDRVATDPAPHALMMGFGDSSLDFELRFWINDPENGEGSPRNDVCLAIHDLFQVHNIEIPFPQRVVHMKK